MTQGEYICKYEQLAMDKNLSVASKCALYKAMWEDHPEGHLCPESAYRARRMLLSRMPHYWIEHMCGKCGEPLIQGEGACPSPFCENDPDLNEWKPSVAFRYFSLIELLRWARIQRCNSWGSSRAQAAR